jgi:hypothetical protein
LVWRRWPSVPCLPKTRPVAEVHQQQFSSHPPPLFQGNNQRSLWPTSQSDLVDKQIKIQNHQGAVSLTQPSTRTCRPCTSLYPYASGSTRPKQGEGEMQRREGEERQAKKFICLFLFSLL